MQRFLHRQSSYFRRQGRIAYLHYVMQLPSGEQANPIDLHYVDSFLLPLSAAAWPGIVPLPVLPPSFEIRATKAMDYSRSAWRGHYCSHCGRLSSRSDWRALACDACARSVETRPPIYEDPIALQDSVPRIDPTLLDGMGLVMTPVAGIEGWEGFSIQVGDGARIHHLWRQEETKLEDKLFREYQGEQAGKLFKRNTLSQHRRKSLLLGFTRRSAHSLCLHLQYLARIFARSFPLIVRSDLCSASSRRLGDIDRPFAAGAEYNHVVNVETYPFDRPLGVEDTFFSSNNESRAPSCVREACEHLSDVAQLVCAEGSESRVGFNEVLSVAYSNVAILSFGRRHRRAVH